jgi:hypothetical protein
MPLRPQWPRSAFSGAFVILLTWADLSGCIDTHQRFGDYLGRLPDAPIDSSIDAPPLRELPDVTGTFLLGLATSIAPDSPLQFRMINGLQRNMDGTGTLMTRLQALSLFPSPTRMPVGMEMTTTVPVDSAGQFALTFNNVMIDGAANPLTGNAITITTTTMMGTLRSADRLCGTVTGMVTQPIQVDLTGSTFGAIRVPDGATGMALPQPETACPSIEPDAGLPDATMPDGGVPDAVPDAPVDAVPDA